MTNLDIVLPSSINNATLLITPNYLQHPIFPYGSYQSTSILDSQMVTLLCRVADDAFEIDFVEFDFNKLPKSGSYERLLSNICHELDINHIDRLRRLPDIRVRNDNDVERLKDNHKLEVILIKR